MLRSLDPHKVKHLVLLGDIFDFYFGSSPYFKKKYASIFAEIEKITLLGIKVYYLQGNHEFGLRNSKDSNIEYLNDSTISIKVDNQKIILSHGDLVFPPWHYRLYARLVRSATFTVMGRLVPPPLLDKIALKISSKSRSSSQNKRIPHKKIVAGLAQWSSRFPGSIAFVGHFHVKYSIKFQSGQVTGLPSWDDPGFIGFENKKVFRYSFSKDGQKIRKKQSFFIDIKN